MTQLRRLVSSLVFLGLAALAAAPVLRAQAPGAKRPAFDSVVIKRHIGPGRSFVQTPGDGRFLARNMTVKGLLETAFPEFQLVGLPPWANTDGYDIDAQDNPKLSRDQIQQGLLNSLLIDRFGLKMTLQEATKPIRDKDGVFSIDAIHASTEN